MRRGAPMSARFWRPLYRAFIHVESAALTLAGLAMFVIMIIASADVMMRYLFNAPFVWTHELIRLYLIPILVYLAVSGAFAAHAHIAVDILQYRLSPRRRQWTYLITDALGAVFFAAIAWGTFWRAHGEYVDGDVLAGIILWNVWPSSAIVSFGSLLLAIRAAAHTVLRAITLATGEELIGVPPLAVEEDFSAEVQ